MKKTFIILLTLLTACQFGDKKNNSNNLSCDNYKQKILTTLALIDSIRSNDKLIKNEIDPRDSLNDAIYKILQELVPNDKYADCNFNTPYSLGYVISSDKKLCLISWNTTQGGTMTDYTTVAIYKADSGVKIKTLHYEDDENSKEYFDTLLTVTKSNGDKVYIAYGHGKESSWMPVKILQAFQIKNDLEFDSIPIFPDGESGLGLEYDITKFSETDSIANIIFIDGGRQLKIPDLNDSNVFVGKYYTLTFDGDKYIRR